MLRALKIYIFFLPFVSAFAITSVLTLPVVFACILWLAILYQFTTRPIPLTILGDNTVFLSFAFLLSVWVSFFYNGLGHQKSTNHFVAYNSSILMFFTGIVLAFNYIGKRSLPDIYRAILTITIVSSLFAFIEFLLKNTIQLDINGYLPRKAMQEFDALALAELFRARSFTEESGHFALFLEVFSPFCFYFMYFSGQCFWKKYIKLILSFIMFLAWVSVVSPASFIIVPVGYIIALVLFYRRIKSKKNIRQTAGVILAGLLVFLLILNFFFPVVDLFVLSVVDKLDSNSFDDRQDRNLFFFEYFGRSDILNQLVGNGPAAYAILDFDDGRSILSLYYSISFELGLLGIIVLMLFFISVFIKILALETRLGFFMMAAFISALIHYNFVSNYWFPWIWFLCAFIVHLSKQNAKPYSLSTIKTGLPT